MEKKFFFKIIGIIVAVVTAMAGIVIWIDPFYHYHKPLSYISYVSGADVYSNDGKLKHFDYDTLTIGTSMAMNFRKENVDTILGGNSLNVYYLGEGFKVINEGLETALETHPDLKLVVRTVDTTWFVSAVNWEGRESYPEYLYDKNPFNDVYYIYNKDVWKDNLIPSIVQSFENGFQGEVKQEGFGSRGLTGKGDQRGYAGRNGRLSELFGRKFGCKCFTSNQRLSGCRILSFLSSIQYLLVGSAKPEWNRSAGTKN